MSCGPAGLDGRRGGAVAVGSARRLGSARRSSRARPVLAGVFRNRDLRRGALSYAGFISAEYSVWIAMLVYAFGQGGATTAGLVALVQLVPAALFAPYGGVLADRRSPARVLVAAYVAQGAAMGATALELVAGGPPVLAYLFA